MKSTYQIKFSGSLSITKGAVARAEDGPDVYRVEGQLEREEEDELSTAEHVRLEGFRALAPVVPSDGSDDPKGVMGAVKAAADSIAEALREGKSASDAN